MIIFLFLLIFQIGEASQKLFSGELVEKYVLKNPKYVDNPGKDLVFKDPFALKGKDHECAEKIFKIIHDQTGDCADVGKKYECCFDFDQEQKVSATWQYCTFKDTTRNEGYWTSIIQGPQFFYVKSNDKDPDKCLEASLSCRDALQNQTICYFILNSCSPSFLNEIPHKKPTKLCLAHISQIEHSMLEYFTNLVTLSLYKCVISQYSNAYTELLQFSPKLKRLILDHVQQNDPNDKLVIIDLDPLSDLEKLIVRNTYIKIENKKPLEKLSQIEINQNDKSSIYRFAEGSFANLKKITWKGDHVPDHILPMIFLALKKTVQHASLEATNLGNQFENNTFPLLKTLCLKSSKENVISVSSSIFEHLEQLDLQYVDIKNHAIKNYKKLKKLKLWHVGLNEQINVADLSVCEEIDVDKSVLDVLFWGEDRVVSPCCKNSFLTIKKKNQKKEYNFEYYDEKIKSSMSVSDATVISVVAPEEGGEELATLNAKNVTKLKIKGNISEIILDENVTNLKISNNSRRVFISKNNRLTELLVFCNNDTIFLDNTFPFLEKLRISVNSKSNFDSLEEKIESCIALKTITIECKRKCQEKSIGVNVENVTLLGCVKIKLGDKCHTLCLKGFSGSFEGGNNIETLIIENENNKLSDVDIFNVKNITLHYKNINEENGFWQKIINKQGAIRHLTVTHIPVCEKDTVQQMVMRDL